MNIKYETDESKDIRLLFEGDSKKKDMQEAENANDYKET